MNSFLQYVVFVIHRVANRNTSFYDRQYIASSSYLKGIPVFYLSTTHISDEPYLFNHLIILTPV